MTSPESTSRPRYVSIYDLLNQVAADAASLEEAARSQLREEGDREGHLEKLKDRARLISELPTTLEEFGLGGGIVPDEVKGFAEYYADIADEAMARNTPFMLSTVLNLAPGGPTIGPNDLEVLAARYEPPQE